MELETDAVYLLDVTSSMVGKSDSADILPKVLDTLLLEIDQFQTGRLTLITFAEGAYDLDGVGSIKAIYRIHIRTEQDKLFLKQFIRPRQYGPFPDDPSWPGIYEKVYEKTYKQRISIGNTAVYDSILLALEEMELLQNQFPGGPEAYTASHTQEIVVFTDGRDNASRHTFNSIMSQLRTRHFQMAERFRYKRYLFSDKREDRKQAGDECAILEKSGAAGYAQNVVAPDVAQLVILGLDRQMLGFPNLWSVAATEDSRTVVLRNIQLFYDKAKEKLLQGGRLIFKHPRAQDFGLPGDVAIRLKTEPSELIFPLNEFNLSLTFEPFSKVETHLNQLKKGELVGALQMKFVTQDESLEQAVFEQSCRLSAKGKALIDIKNPSPVVSLPFMRPSLTVDVRRSAVNQLRFDFMPNKVFSDLSQEQRMLEVHLLPALSFVSLFGESGTPLTWGTLPLPSRPSTFYVTFTGGRACGDVQDIEIRLRSTIPSLLINGKSYSSISFLYQIASLVVQPSQIITENLWSSEQWLSGFREPITAKFSLGFCGGIAGKLRLFVKNLSVPAQVRIEPETLDLDQPSAQELRFQITVQPQTNWETLSQRLESSSLHGHLQVFYEPKQDNVLSALPEPLPLTLSYRPRYVAVSIEVLAKEKATPGTAVYRLEVHGVEVSSNEPLISLQAPEGAPNVWIVHRTDSSEALPLAESLPLQSGTYELRLSSNLKRSIQQGMFSLSTQGGGPLLVQLGQQEERRVNGQYSLNYTLEVGDLLAIVNCSGLAKESRWRRGQALLRCEPRIEGIPPNAQMEVTPRCGQGLSVRANQSEQYQRCGKSISLQPFEVIIAPDAPPGPSAVTQMVEHLEVGIYNRSTQKSIETNVAKPEMRGYLLPKPYDQFWEPLLHWLVWLIWGSGLFVLLGTITYAVVWIRENPLSFLVNYVWYDDRWRWMTGGWLALGVLMWLTQMGIAWGMRLYYGR